MTQRSAPCNSAEVLLKLLAMLSSILVFTLRSGVNWLTQVEAVQVPDPRGHRCNISASLDAGGRSVFCKRAATCSHCNDRKILSHSDCRMCVCVFFFVFCIILARTLTQLVMQMQRWQEQPLLRKVLSWTPNQPFSYLKATSGGSHIRDGKGGQASDDSSILPSRRCCHDNRALRPPRDVVEVEG